MANTKIKWFRNTNKNAPQLTNNWGGLVKLFDACLINGFTAQANTWYSVEIVRKAGVVTYYINGSKYTSATVNKAINFIENGKVIIGAASDTTGANGSIFFI